MKQKTISIAVHLLVLFFSLLLVPDQSSAQMTSGFPRKFRLTGFVELQYRNYWHETSSSRSTNDDTYSNFKERIRLHADGFIYHPRLIVYSAAVDFSHQKSLTGVDIKGKDLSYSLLVTALPYRPISLDLFASRDHYSFEAKTQALPDRTVTHYGAKMRFNIEKVQPLRLIRLRYEHWGYATENISEDTVTDTYSISVHGLLSKLKTVYTVTSTLTNFTSPVLDIDTKFFSAYTDTNLTKKGVKLINSFFYSDFQYSIGDYTKDLNYSADLDFPPGERYYHDYRFVFNQTEQFYKGSEASGTRDRLSELSYQIITGSWGYRFSDRLIGSLFLDYGKRKVDSEKGEVTGISTSLAYRRPLGAFNTESSYRFILKKDELRNDFTEHYITINLKTRRFSLGTGYFTYTFIKSDSESKVFEESDEFYFDEEAEKVEIGKRTTKTLSHSVVLGLRGRGFGKMLRRAIWTVENSYFNTTSDIKRPIRTTDEFGGTEITFEDITRKTHQYSIYGQIVVPIRTTMNINSRATYAIGETDSFSRQSFVMHTRINYRLQRNLTFAGLVRGRWEKIENSPNRTIIDYEASLDYRRGKLHCLLEFFLSTTKQKDLTFWSRRIFLTIRRYI